MLSALRARSSVPGPPPPRPELRGVELPQWIALYDSVNAASIPAHAAAVAGYINGAWPSLRPLTVRFPNALWLSITVSSSADAMVLDVESGDSSPADAAIWVARQKELGIPRPALYVSLSGVGALLEDLRRRNLRRNQIRLWIADWTGRQHQAVVQLPGADGEAPGATQWTDHAGLDYDESVTTRGWLHAVRGAYFAVHGPLRPQVSP